MELIGKSIGEKAGILWYIFEENSELSISQLKSLTHLPSSEIYMAIGWLSREGKIYSNVVKGVTYYSNRQCEAEFIFG